MLELILGKKKVKDVIEPVISFLRKVEEEYGDKTLVEVIKNLEKGGAKK
ncbi:hypothetical protein [Archaeoglobus veneficus]|uniref:Uncharacterized protein n=1 Tax=Archaeoglobus veneficus (strain DSM 11195 / SNP6) TaxID=693661 RepID=F2KSI5_ARCVS|nr:hypothetical protein [Archaeoglobus veneficus]AEA48055.1 hypothetical protein Arcve_2065 [Archaeoglobus veneficus SNP6]